MTDDPGRMRPATEDEVRLRLREAGLDLPEELVQQFLAAWPGYEAMVQRMPRSYGYADEPAHIFPPERIAKA